MLKLVIAIAGVAAATVLAVPVLAAPNAQTVRVTESEYRIALSARPKAGTVTFVIRNAGDDGHDFWVRGGGRTWKSRALGEGGAARLTARLRAGVRYQYWCGVGSHADKGMRGSFVAR
jgi:plastocyanin